MSDKAIDVQVASAHPQFMEEVGQQIESLPPRGPGILPTVFLMVRVTFRKAAWRKILWIAIFVTVLFLALLATADLFLEMMGPEPGL